MLYACRILWTRLRRGVACVVVFVFVDNRRTMGAGDLWAADAVTDTAQEVVSAKVEDLLHVASRGGFRGAGSATTARRERRTELRKTKGRTSSSSELLEVTSSETEPELLRDRGILVRLSYTLQPGGGGCALGSSSVHHHRHCGDRWDLRDESSDFAKKTENSDSQLEGRGASIAATAGALSVRQGGGRSGCAVPGARQPRQAPWRVRGSPALAKLTWAAFVHDAHHRSRNVRFARRTGKGLSAAMMTPFLHRACDINGKLLEFLCCCSCCSVLRFVA